MTRYNEKGQIQGSFNALNSLVIGQTLPPSVEYLVGPSPVDHYVSQGDGTFNASQSSSLATEISPNHVGPTRADQINLSDPCDHASLRAPNGYMWQQLGSLNLQATNSHNIVHDH